MNKDNRRPGGAATQSRYGPVARRAHPPPAGLPGQASEPAVRPLRHAGGTVSRRLARPPHSNGGTCARRSGKRSRAAGVASEGDCLLRFLRLLLIRLRGLTGSQELHAVGEDPDGLALLPVPVVHSCHSSRPSTAIGRPFVRKRAHASPLAPKTVTSK